MLIVGLINIFGNIYGLIVFPSIELNLIFYFLVKTESCDGTIVNNGTDRIIVDSNNDTWTINDQAEVLINEKNASYSNGVLRIVYWKKFVYQQNFEQKWWRWENDVWRDAPQAELSQLNSMEDCVPSSSLKNQGNQQKTMVFNSDQKSSNIC